MIDTHSHLNDPKYAGIVGDVIARAAENGVKAIVVCGYDLPSSKLAVDLAEHYDKLFATVGIHPHDAKNYNFDTEKELAELAKRPRVIAIGEIGLDYHYSYSPKTSQREAFAAQLDLAAKLELPVVIHSREAHDETMSALLPRIDKLVGGVFHCFSGNQFQSKEVLDIGFAIGVDGPITYKNATILRNVVATCPLEHILIETDCPYLTPAPHRGKMNEPCYLKYIAEELGRIKATGLEEVDQATTRNALALFPKMAGER